MKKNILIILIFLLALFAFSPAYATCTKSTCTAYESFETTGYEKGASWSESIGASCTGCIVDENYPASEDIAGNLPVGGATEILECKIPAGVSSTYLALAIFNEGTSRPIVYEGFWFNLKEVLTFADADIKYITQAFETSGVNYSMRFTVLNTSGVYTLQFRYYSNGNQLSAVAPALTLDTWYWIESKYDITNHTWQWWLDGVSQDSGALHATLHRTGTQEYRLGLQGTTYAFNGTVLFDTLKIATDGQPGQDADFSYTTTTYLPTGAGDSSVWDCQDEGRQKGTASDTVIVDYDGRNLTTLGISVDNTVNRIDTACSSTVQSISTTNSTNDTMNVTDNDCNFTTNIAWNVTSTCTGWGNVSDSNDNTAATLVDPTTDWCGAGADACKDLYAVANPSVSGTLGKILAVQLWARSRQVGNARICNFGLKTHATEYWPDQEATASPEAIFHAADSYEDQYAILETNPNTGKPWTWDEIQALQIGLKTPKGATAGGWYYGGSFSEEYIKVIHGSYLHRFVDWSPNFPLGYLTSTSIGINVKAGRPSYIGTSKGIYLRLKVCTDSSCTTSEYTSSVQVFSATDWTHTFNVTTFGGNPLSANTQYWFDIENSPDGSTWRSVYTDNGWTSYPSCYTAPSSSTEFDFVVSNDMHSTGNTFFKKILDASPTPRFILLSGDIGVDHQGVLTEARRQYKDRRGGMSYDLQKVMWKMGYGGQWDDHDFWGNDAGKDADLKWNSLRAFLEYRPFLNTSSRLTGTTDATPQASKIVDADASFPASMGNNLARALVVNTTASPPTYTYVTARDSATILSLNDDIFTSGSQTYEIYQGTWHNFSYGGLAEFYLTDLRYLRDNEKSTVDTGGFGTVDGWSEGLDWDISGGVANAIACSGNLSQSQTLENGHKYQLSYDIITCTTGTVTPYLGAVAGTTKTCPTTGTFTDEFTASSGTMTLKFTAAALTGAIDNVILRQTDSDMMDGSGDGNGAVGATHTQRDWFVSGMNNSSKIFKFWVSTVPLNHTITNTSYDQWWNYDPLHLQLDYIENTTTAIDIISLTGDKHYTAIDDGTNGKWPEQQIAPISLGWTHESEGTWSEAWDAGLCGQTSVCNSGMFYAIIQVRTTGVTTNVYNEHGVLLKSVVLEYAGPEVSIPSFMRYYKGRRN